VAYRTFISRESRNAQDENVVILPALSVLSFSSEDLVGVISHQSSYKYTVLSIGRAVFISDLIQTRLAGLEMQAAARKKATV
jgi:hypothetical protein